MTQEEFGKLIPGKSILKTEINGEEKNVLFKFFLCNTGVNFDGYWLCVTEDFSNPNPQEVMNTDSETHVNLCEVIKFL